MATIIVATIAALCKKHRISEEQFDKATYCVANGKQGFYIVESQSEPGVEYHVTWNERYNALACTCKAGQNGVPCWHKRAASASHEHYRQEQAVRRQREQAEVEATPEYKLEQAFRELEDALDKLDEIAAKADAREQARRDAERTAYLNFELSMGI